MKELIKKNIIKTAALLSLVMSFVFFIVSQGKDIKTVLKTAVPDAEEMVLVSHDPVIYEIKKQGEIHKYAATGNAPGYQSDVSVLVIVDKEGILENAIVLEQNETPAFFRRLITKSFFGQFSNIDIRKGVNPQSNIDTVTSATVSSVAFTKAVNRAISHIGKEKFGIDVPPLENEITFGSKEFSLILLMIFAVYASYKRKSGFRIFAAVYSVFVLGFWFNIFINYGSLVALFGGVLPPPENLAWYILFSGTLGLILFTGRNIYCAWLCPFGAMQDLVNRAGFKGFRRNPVISRYARKMLPFFAWAAAVSALLAGHPNLAGYEPFSTAFTLVGSAAQWVLLPMVLFSGLFMKRFWCNFFCPVGYVLNKFTLFRNRLNFRIRKKAV